MKKIIIIGNSVQQAMFAVDLLGLHPNQCLWVIGPDQLQGVSRKIVFLLDGWDSNFNTSTAVAERQRMIAVLKDLVGQKRIQLFNLNLDQL